MQGRKLTAEEVEALHAKKNPAGNSRQIKEELYDSLAAPFEAGDFGELTLGIDEKKLTVRKNFTKAFTRRGLKLDWRRGKADTLRFHVLAE